MTIMKLMSTSLISQLVTGILPAYSPGQDTANVSSWTGYSSLNVVCQLRTQRIR